MRRTASLLAAVFLISAAFGNHLAAQTPDRGIVEVGTVSRSSSSATRAGFYGAFGLGAGRESYKYSDEPHYSEQLTKPTLSLRAGGTPSDRVRVGGEIFAWGNEVAGAIESFSTFTMTGQFFFNNNGGPFLRGGAGFARSGTSYDDGGSAYENGFGWSWGAGWDLQVSRNVAITPSIDMYSGTFTKRNEPTITEHVINIGVGVTFQTGRKR